MVHGWGGDYVGDVPVIGPLSDGSFIPALHLHDGPQGVANGNTQVTCWPSALTVVQSWDQEAMAAYGAGMGREQFLKGSNVIIGEFGEVTVLDWGLAKELDVDDARSRAEADERPTIPPPLPLRTTPGVPGRFPPTTTPPMRPATPPVAWMPRSESSFTVREVNSTFTLGGAWVRWGNICRIVSIWLGGAMTLTFRAAPKMWYLAPSVRVSRHSCSTRVKSAAPKGNSRLTIPAGTVKSGTFASWAQPHPASHTIRNPSHHLRVFMDSTLTDARPRAKSSLRGQFL
jgi:hypothetical protein